MTAAQLQRACENVDAVVHLAGTNARDSAADPAAALAFNAGCTAALVDVAATTDVGRLIYVSTGHVYANPLHGTIDETTPTRGAHAYATSHLAGEAAVRAAHADRSLDGIVIRLSNAFGAPMVAETDCWTLLINDVVRQAQQSGAMVLKSSGLQRRDFIPMREACRAIAHLLTLPREQIGDGLFNVGGGYSPTVVEITERVADRIERATGVRPPIRSRRRRWVNGAMI